MLTENFKAGDVLGVVKRVNPRRAGFDKALIQVALSKIYPDVRLDVSESNGKTALDGVNLTVLAGMNIYQDMNDFAALAVRVAELHNAGFDWPAPTASPALIDVAFQHYLDNPDVWDEIKAAIRRLDFPNGKEGTAWELLSDEEKKAQRSAKSATSGGKNSGANSG